MKAVASYLIFLYQFQTVKQKLWTTLVMYSAFCINKQQPDGRMRCKMNKLTLLRSALLNMGQPRDVANVVLFLTCPLSDCITGIVLDINDGLYMGG